MPTPDPNAHDQPLSRLQAFSEALAYRLPGPWNAVAKAHFAYSPAYVDVIDRLWDNGPVERTLQRFAPDRAALLNGPSGERLVVLAAPRPGRFLVAALAPPGIDGSLRADHTPRDIAVPGDPVRAAADVDRRLLPRYRQAVEAVRVPALGEAHRLAQQALDDWDAVSDSLCDAAGIPLDEDAYGARQVRRDAEAWEPFETFLFHGPAAIGHAKAALTTLPLPASTAARWEYRLRSLAAALTEGTSIRDEWESRLAAVLDQQVGPDRWVAFNEGLAERNAEGWYAVTIFMDHAPVLQAIADAEQEHAELAAVRVAAARARSTTTGAAPRPGTRLPQPAPGPRSTTADPAPAPPPQDPTTGRRTR
jgi:hypothetical protein